MIAGGENDRGAFAIVVLTLDELRRGSKLLLSYDLVIEACRAEAIGTRGVGRNRRQPLAPALLRRVFCAASKFHAAPPAILLRGLVRQKIGRRRHGRLG